MATTNHQHSHLPLHLPSNMDELSLLHILMAVGGSFIVLLVLLDIFDKDGMSYHRWLTGDKYKNVKPKKKEGTPSTEKTTEKKKKTDDKDDKKKN